MFDNLNNALDKLEPYDGVLFIGEVVDATDPLNLNRVRARVIDLYEGSNDLIPWAIPLKESRGGVYGSPPVGAKVVIMLQKGNPHYPLYMSIQTEANADFPNGAWGYSDQYGNKFIVSKDGIELSTKCGAKFKIGSDCKVTLDAPGGFDINGNVKIKGNFDLTGNYSSTGSMKNNGKDIGGGHMHAVLAKDFGITSRPL